MSTISAGVTVPTALNLSGDTTGALTFQVSGTVTAATISSAGNFGIGTASPGYRLDVNSGSNFLAGRFTSTSTATVVPFVDSNTTGIGPYVGSTGNALTFGRAGVAEYVRIDSSGNVGIGTASPSYKLQVNNASASSTADAITVQNSGVSNTGHIAGIRFRYITAEPAAIRAILTNTINGAGALGFFTSSDGSGANLTERMRVTSDGNLGVGQGTPTARLDVLADSGNIVRFINSSVVGVSLAAGSTSFTTLSDERSKTDLVPINDAVSKLKELRTVVGRYNQDDVGVERSFLIAQDVQKVFPPAVDANKPDELGLRYTDMIPLLVAAIKEQQEQIKALQDKVAALESK